MILDQRTNGGKWNYLGSYFFETGEGGYVELSDAASGTVLGDAVRFVMESR